MESKTRFSAGALLIAALCVACGGKSSALRPVGSAGSGGGTSGAAGQSGAAGDAQPVDADAAQPVDSDGAAGSAGSIADGGDDLANDVSGEDRTAPPRLAANGVPIPPAALAKDSCAYLAVQSVACRDDGTCQPLSCDCGGKLLVFDRCFSACVSGISCPAACAVGFNAPSLAFNCLTNNPTCRSDSDCKQSQFFYKCLVPPNAASGECITGNEYSPCLADADCRSKACIVTSEGLGYCPSEFRTGCNIDQHCPAGHHCALAPGAFSGQCTDGKNSGFCVTQDDCQPSLACVVQSQGNRVCTSRGTGAPCEGEADCQSGFFCVGSAGVLAKSCASGAAGARCMTESQCHVPFCVNFRCSQGAPGDTCHGDKDCQGFCAQGMCSNGALGEPCRLDHTGCAAGLHCPNSGPLICVGQ